MTTMYKRALRHTKRYWPLYLVSVLDLALVVVSIILAFLVTGFIVGDGL